MWGRSLSSTNRVVISCITRKKGDLYGSVAHVLLVYPRQARKFEVHDSRGRLDSATSAPNVIVHAVALNVGEAEFHAFVERFRDGSWTMNGSENQSD